MRPTIEGVFKPVQIKWIHFLRCDVNEIYCGNSCPIKLRSLDKNFELTTQNFIKGMMLVSENHLITYFWIWNWSYYCTLFFYNKNRLSKCYS